MRQKSIKTQRVNDRNERISCRFQRACSTGKKKNVTSLMTVFGRDGQINLAFLEAKSLKMEARLVENIASLFIPWASVCIMSLN